MTGKRMLRDAQSTMRQNYVNGGPGVFVSGLVWLSAALIFHLLGLQAGMLALFVGGMLIVPVAGVIERRLRTDVPEPDKGLTRLALLTLPLLFGGLFVGYVMSARSESWFFQIVAVAIGLRYLVFSRIYGLKTFIALGLTLVAIGVIAQLSPLRPVVVPLAVGIVEVAFGCFLMRISADA